MLLFWTISRSEFALDILCPQSIGTGPYVNWFADLEGLLNDARTLWREQYCYGFRLPEPLVLLRRRQSTVDVGSGISRFLDLGSPQQTSRADQQQAKASSQRDTGRRADRADPQADRRGSSNSGRCGERCHFRVRPELCSYSSERGLEGSAAVDVWKGPVGRR